MTVVVPPSATRRLHHSLVTVGQPSLITVGSAPYGSWSPMTVGAWLDGSPILSRSLMTVAAPSSHTP
jgi:hypothetical protein